MTCVAAQCIALVRGKSKREGMGGCRGKRKGMKGKRKVIQEMIEKIEEKIGRITYTAAQCVEFVRGKNEEGAEKGGCSGKR